MSHSRCNSVDCIAGPRGQDKDFMAHSCKKQASLIGANHFSFRGIVGSF